MIPHERPPDREQPHGSRRRRGAHRSGGNAQRTPGSGDTQAPWRQRAADAAPREHGLQPIPIVEVGTQVRAHDGQRGIVLDVQDTDGPLTYLVQLDGQATAQFIPARTLKGAQI